MENWFQKVKIIYDKVLDDTSALNSGSIIIDIDETILYDSDKEIPGSVDFVNNLHKKFTIFIVTGRFEHKLDKTIQDLKNYKYHKLILRPSGEGHSDFKLRIKTEINPIVSMGDQKTDHPTHLIPNPFYYINSDGSEIYYRGKRMYADICGDLFHYGHAEFFKKLKAIDNYVIIGLHSDDVIQSIKRRPILTMDERKKIIETCRYVDEVQINAPLQLSEEFIKKNNFDFVCHAHDVDDNCYYENYKVPMEMGIFIRFDYTHSISTSEIINRCKNI